MAYDAVIIPGGGVREGGELPIWVLNRLDYAIQHHGSAPIICLSAGTTYKPPPLNAKGYPIFESKAAAHYLVQQGVQRDLVLSETASYDTIGNAYFLLMIHLLPRRWQNLLIVTSAFHMPRTQATFEWVLGLDGLPFEFALEFQSVEDRGMDAVALQARYEKEASSLKNVRNLASSIKTLPDFHRWLFTDHDAYATSIDPPDAQSPDLLQTY